MSWGFCFPRVESSRLLVRVFESRARVSGNAEVSGYGPGTAVPTPYLILVAGSIFMAVDVALCRPAGRVDLKAWETVLPGHGQCLSASRAAGQPCGVAIRATRSLPSWQKRPGTVRGRTRITGPAKPGIVRARFCGSSRSGLCRRRSGVSECCKTACSAIPYLLSTGRAARFATTTGPGGFPGHRRSFPRLTAAAGGFQVRISPIWKQHNLSHRSAIGWWRALPGTGTPNPRIKRGSREVRWLGLCVLNVSAGEMV